MELASDGLALQRHAAAQHHSLTGLQPAREPNLAAEARRDLHRPLLKYAGRRLDEDAIAFDARDDCRLRQHDPAHRPVADPDRYSRAGRQRRCGGGIEGETIRARAANISDTATSDQPR